MQPSSALVAQQPAQMQYAPAKADADLARKRRLFRAFEENKKREIDEQKEARRYYSGRQWTDAEIAVLNKRKQPVIWDNRINRKIDFLVGVEQRMRRDPKAFGRGPQDQKTADVATASLRFVCDHNRWEVIGSDSSHDGMVSGIGVAWVGIENATRGPDVKVKRGQVDRFFYDPRSAMPDFSDARYMGMHLWLDIDDLKAEYPHLTDQLESMVDTSGSATMTHLDEEREQQWADFEQRRARVVEMYERKTIHAKGPAWYFCKFSGGITLESMWSPYLDENGVPDCPYVAWSPYIDERGDRYGVVRNMRPMQDEVNQRRSKLLHLTNVRQIHMQQGVVDDVDETRDELSKPDGVIKHNGTWGQDIGVVENDREMRGQADLLLQAQSALENLGPNPGLVGKGGGIADQSGRAILAQRDSGMTELSPVFERLRDWKLRCYRKMWARIRQAWTGERYIRITEDPKAPTYLGVNKYGMDEFGMISAQNVIGEIDVDIILDEGPDTIVMQEELLQTLSQLGEAATGPMGKVMIELSQVSNKDALLAIMDKATQPAPEVAALQQRMQELEAAMAQAKVAREHAETENKRADTTLKMMQAMVPPQAMSQMYPMPFGDSQPPQAMPPQQPQMMPDQGMPPPDQMMGEQMGMDPGVPQDMPLEQMPGGLPLDGELGSTMSAGMQNG
jgi:hypothetical protein